jgi:MYXO-CTERM domain-containing protein
MVTISAPHPRPTSGSLAVQMFEGDTHHRVGGFEPVGVPPVPAGSEGGASPASAADGYLPHLLVAAAVFSLFGVVTLVIAVFAVHPPLTTALLGSSTGWLLLALLALLAWWRRRRQPLAP